jgi:hypothetical protein
LTLTPFLRFFKQTTDEFREEHGKHIFKDGHGMEVGHIIAHSNGGADHPDNYLPLGTEINKTMQETNDELMCYFAGESRAKRAMQISSELGNMCFKADGSRTSGGYIYPGQESFKVSSLDGECADIYFVTGKTCYEAAFQKLKLYNQKRKRHQYEREQKDGRD